MTTLLYSTFANDLKRKYFFRKMFINTEYAALTNSIKHDHSGKILNIQLKLQDTKDTIQSLSTKHY